MSSAAERDALLGRLVDEYQRLRESDPGVGISALRVKAGELFPDLAEVAEFLSLLEASWGEGADESLPAAVGPYRPLQRLGRGVSGEVFRAVREGGSGEVALKVVHEALALSSEALRRFEREIETAGKLDHQHLVRVLDHGEASGRLYLAMEFVDGVPLSGLIARLESVGLPPDDEWLACLDAHGIAKVRGGGPVGEIYARRIAGLFLPVARGLAVAHRAGLIHRDLKPGNLMLDRQGRLRIIDFGLAKVIGEEMTRTVAVLGTPGYMCPEQAAGQSRDVDASADVYALGATLYRCLTLRFPVEGESFGEVLAAILTTKPDPIREMCADYPASLERVVTRCLEKRPEDRYEDVDQLAEDLEDIAGAKRLRSSTDSVQRRAGMAFKRQRRKLLVAAVVLVAGGAGAWWWLTRPARLVVRALPGGTLSLNDRALGDNEWTGQLESGPHSLTVTHPGFVTHHETVELSTGVETRITVHLNPVNPFDRDALTLVATAYDGRDVSLPPDVAVQTRAIDPEDLPIPEPQYPGAYAEQLARFDADVRDRAHVRAVVIARLLEEGLAAEAYAAAADLAADHPEEPFPLRLQLAALEQLGLVESRSYVELLNRFRARSGR